MEIKIGDKVKGFKFETFIDECLDYEDEMDNHIGEIGTVTYVSNRSIGIQFDDDHWYYPLEETKKHIVEEDKKDMEKKFEKGDNVEVVLRGHVSIGVITDFLYSEEVEYKVEYVNNGYICSDWLIERNIKLIEEDSQESKPKHYQTDSIDVIDFCNIYNLSFSLGNVVKYVCRAGKKENESTLKDLNKAKDYIEREIKFLEG